MQLMRHCKKTGRPRLDPAQKYGRVALFEGTVSMFGGRVILSWRVNATRAVMKYGRAVPPYRETVTMQVIAALRPTATEQSASRC